ncbi:penicillin-binding protein [Alphaproteobacteria bacterium KMM 3653]|uniref:peptidoglycan glycosyltransferase n=1 Tax=Harenicola maris TaxID=2841044 RepID=A0AAP2CPE3_9RHOB|nr:penicillin-binding protein [Harenicola maris]
MAPTGKKRRPVAAPKRTTATPKAKSRAKRTKKARRGPIAWVMRIIGFFLRLIWSFTWRSAAVLCLLIGAAVSYFYTTLPELDELVDGRTRGSVTLLDHNDKTFAWRGEQFGGFTSVDAVSPVLAHAVVATEDKRFYRHFGVSPRGVASAVRINLREGRGPLSGHGGSTLTQQTAKLLCLGVPFDPTTGMTEAEYEADCRRGTMWRKIKEAVYAMAMEARYTKDEILTIYLNRAYLGGGARGFEAAAQRYFGIPASQLDAAQSAMLAGLLVAPTRYAPTNNLERAQARAETVLRLMAEQGYISDADRAVAVAEPATLSQAAQARAGGYFADWVMDTGPSFLTKDTTEDVILSTTLDQRLQTAAEEAMKTVFETKVREGSEAQAAIVVMSADGAVRAMVGGRQTKVSGAFNRATMAKRQTGSSFKPFVYAAAMDLGYTPGATVVDEPLTINVPGSGAYSPQNYDKKFHGRVTLSKALQESYNIPAVRVSEAVGRENVRKIAEGFGIESDLAAGPALALGVSESTLLEMTGAYAGILNGGTSVTPYGLRELRLQGDDEPLMGQGGGFGERVITEEAAQYLTFMMFQVVDRGTGVRAKLDGRQAAGKTGTTQAARDAWFIGFTADYVVGVWMGYDDNTPLTGVTGGGLPADIWRETMVRVNEGMPVKPLPLKIPPSAIPAQKPPRDPGGTAQNNAATGGNTAQGQQQQAQSPAATDRERRRAERQARRDERRQNGTTADKVLEDVLINILRGGGN